MSRGGAYIAQGVHLVGLDEVQELMPQICVLPDHLENRPRIPEKSPLAYTKMYDIAQKNYPNISKYIQDIPRYTKYRAAAGPPRPARPRRHGPAYLGIFLYILDILLVYSKMEVSGPITRTF